MARIKDKEKARVASCIVWEEDVLKLPDVDGDHDKAAGRVYGYCSGLNCKVALSPLHDKDTYTAEDVRNWVDRRIDPDQMDFISTDIDVVRKAAPKVGDKKKAHWHVLFRMDGPVTRDYFTDLMSGLVAIPKTKWEKVNSYDSYLRYLGHLDTTDKYHYGSFGINGFGGIDLSPLTRRNEQSNARIICEILKVAKEMKFRYYYQLLNWAISTGDIDYVNIVFGRASNFNCVLRSKKDHELEIQAAEEAAKKKALESLQK